MSRTLCGGSFNPVAIAAGVTNFFFIGSGTLNATTTEAQAQRKSRKVGTFNYLYVRVTANTLSGNCIVTFRKNTANGNSTVTIPSGGTGTFTDITHTDITALADLIDVQAVTDAGTGSISISVIAFNFSLAGTAATTLHGSDGALAFPTTASLTRFLQLGGLISASLSVEAQAAAQIDVAGTFRNLQLYVLTNTRTTATVFTFRKNGLNGAQTISVGSGVTGFLEDTTHTDAVVATDTVTVSYVSGTGVGQLTLVYVGTEFDSSVANKHQLFSSQATAVTTAARNAPILGGYSQGLGAGALAFGFQAQVSNLRTYVTANTRDETETLSSLFNGAATGTVALSASITAAGTAVFSDTTHTDNVAAQDNYELIRSNGDSVGSYSTSWFTMTVEHQIAFNSTATIANFTSAATITELGKLASTVTIDPFTSVATFAELGKLDSTATIAAFTSVATLTNVEALTSTATIAPFTSVATFAEIGNLSSTATIANFTSVATFAAVEAFSLAQTLAAFTSSATLTAIEALVATRTVDPFTSVATIAALEKLSSNQTIDPFVSTATFAAIEALAALPTIGAFTSVATLTELAQLSASVTFAAFTSTATLQAIDALTSDTTFGQFNVSVTLTAIESISSNITFDDFTSDIEFFILPDLSFSVDTTFDNFMLRTFTSHRLLDDLIHLTGQIKIKSLIGQLSVRHLFGAGS